MPPSASGGRFLCASRPRNRSSRSASRFAAAARLQAYSTNGLRAHGELWCSVRARNSLPVPASPSSSTGVPVGAARDTSSHTSRMASLLPMMLVRSCRPCRRLAQAAVLVGQPDPLAGARAMGGHRRPDELREMFQQRRHMLGRDRWLRRQVHGNRADGALAGHDRHRDGAARPPPGDGRRLRASPRNGAAVVADVEDRAGREALRRRAVRRCAARRAPRPRPTARGWRRRRWRPRAARRCRPGPHWSPCASPGSGPRACCRAHARRRSHAQMSKRNARRPGGVPGLDRRFSFEKLSDSSARRTRRDGLFCSASRIADTGVVTLPGASGGRRREPRLGAEVRQMCIRSVKRKRRCSGAESAGSDS